MTAGTTPQETLSRVAQGDAHVLERLVTMNLDSLEASGLDVRTYFLIRLAALVAIDAPPVSYLINLGLGADAGVTLEEAQGALIAIAPVVGSARVAAAAGNILRAFGLAVVAEEMASAEQG
jgi:4-carboxymuconolactone decarboxylase